MFSAIFLPATLIASIWGMNFSDMPLSGSPNGFWVVNGLIAVSFALVAIVLFRFRFFWGRVEQPRHRDAPSH
jgi:magnesium transporter